MLNNFTPRGTWMWLAMFSWRALGFSENVSEKFVCFILGCEYLTEKTVLYNCAIVSFSSLCIFSSVISIALVLGMR